MGSLGEQCVPARTITKLSPQGRAVLMRCFVRCPFPTREKKDALLEEVQKTDPEYSSAKLIRWFSNRRRFYHESRKEQEDGGENALNSLLDPASFLAREMWPSLSAEILQRLHTMLLEQSHPTAQHKELLAKHFGVEREHVENFLSWRLACLNNEDNDVWRENSHRGRKQLPTTAVDDDDNMEVDELLESQSYLPTPAGSTSPEPVYGMTPFIRAKMGRRESLDKGPFASVDSAHELNSPISPGPMIESNSLSHRPSLHISPNAHLDKQIHPLPYETNPGITLITVAVYRPNAPSAASIPRTSNTRQQGRSCTGTHASSSVASVGKPSRRAPRPATRTPRTLREIERFLRDVESNKLTHIGLTPEMLKQINP
ncbi:hypothetical protein BGY98DRAFT_970376 [Russula aff. rugulosa BPL654]|nr:hypothetical protein BGY98DRAFT_970376 [Russula aff. rugulosa BPL654]